MMKNPDSRKQIWTQGQGIDHRHWIPHVDAQHDKIMTSLEVFWSDEYAEMNVVSNGVLEKTKVDSGMVYSYFHETSTQQLFDDAGHWRIRSL